MATTKKAATSTAPANATATVAGWALTGKQPVKAYRANSARHLWWAAVQAQLKGGPKAATVLYAAHRAAPPSTPKYGKLAGQCEPPAGWYGYLQRQGLVKPTQVKVTQAQATKGGQRAGSA